MLRHSEIVSTGGEGDETEAEEEHASAPEETGEMESGGSGRGVQFAVFFLFLTCFFLGGLRGR